MTRLAGWALELASIEAFDALTTVLEAAVAGALPADAVAAVLAVSSRLAGDSTVVAAVRGAADNIRGDTDGLAGAVSQRIGEAMSQLRPTSMHLPADPEAKTWDAEIEPPQALLPYADRELRESREPPCASGDLIAFRQADSEGDWRIGAALVTKDSGRVSVAWVSGSNGRPDASMHHLSHHADDSSKPCKPVRSSPCVRSLRLRCSTCRTTAKDTIRARRTGQSANTSSLREACWCVD